MSSLFHFIVKWKMFNMESKPNQYGSKKLILKLTANKKKQKDTRFLRNVVLLNKVILLFEKKFLAFK